MASNNKVRATILVLSILLAYSSFVAQACGSCKPPVPKPKPKPKPCPTPAVPSPKAQGKCPTLKLGVCANILGLVNGILPLSPPTSKCCSLIQGLVDAEAALCICAAIKANVLGINLNVPLTLNLLLSACQKSLPSGFQCP